MKYPKVSDLCVFEDLLSKVTAKLNEIVIFTFNSQIRGTVAKNRKIPKIDFFKYFF